MKQPNILVLHTDQQRYDSMGCTGNRFARTPRLDALAGQGTVFDRHIASNTICMPSRASLFTGLYPSGHNVWCNGIALNRREYFKALLEPGVPELTPEPATVADIFGANGYDTAAFGKLHLTPYRAPAVHGFQESDPMWRTGALDEWHGPYYGFRHVELTVHHGKGTMGVGHYGDWLRREHPDAVAAAGTQEQQISATVHDLGPGLLPYELSSTQWLADRFCAYAQSRKESGVPFLAFVGFPDPHHPFRPASDMFPLFADMEVQAPVDRSGECWTESPVADVSQFPIPHVSEEDLRMVLRCTHAMVHQIDLAVGQIVEMLRRTGQWDNTVIVFTSDHGDFLGDHNLLRKGFGACDALLHVPFLLRVPGAKLPARVSDPMSNCDVLPTLGALAGVPMPEGLHGRDVLATPSGGGDNVVFAENGDGRPGTTNLSAYDGRFRYTRYPVRDCEELYDHTEDPGECRNLAGAGHHREVVERMRANVADHLVQTYNPILARWGKW